MKKKWIDLCCLYNSISKIMLRMKLLTFLILVSMASVSANSYSQQTKFKMNLENKTVRQIFQEIEKNSEFIFIYSEKSVDVNRKVNVKVENETVELILDQVFKGTINNYEIHDRQIMILAPEMKESPIPVKSGSEVEPPQKKQLKGKVTDGKGDPIPGTTVIIKGTTVGTITDGNGEFILEVPLDSKTLAVSFVGFTPQEINIGSKTTFDVTLEENTVGLEEVVAVGYGSQKKSTLTGSVSKMGGKELLSAPVANISNSIMGKVSGLTAVAQNFQPGKQTADIFVRGRATWGDAAAIVVVDGVERADFGNIDPNEIESISILKDASSTAIFGVRGANGVVVITTKSGRESKPVVSYSGNVTINVFTNQPKLLDAYNSAILKNEGARFEGLAPMFTDEELQKFKDGSDPIHYPNVDWTKELIRKNNLQTQHNVNVSGGTKLVKYFVSAGYLYEDGLFKKLDSPYNIKTTNDYSRYNFRSNLDFNLTKDLQIGIKLGGRRESTYEPYYGTTLGRIMYQIQLAPTFAYPKTLEDGRLVIVPGAGPSNINPIGMLARSGYQRFEKSNVQTSINFNYKLSWLTEGLSFMTLFTYDNDLNSTVNQTGTFTQYQMDRKTGALTLDPTYRYDNPLGAISSSNTGNMNYNLITGFDYSREFNKHNIVGLARFTRKLIQITGADAPNAIQGLIGRAAYNYDGKYLTEFSAAYNGSENFPKGEQYGFFPAISIGWVVSKEAFLRNNIPAISLFKIRGSYGLAGNDKIGGSRFLYLDDYSSATGAASTTNSAPNTSVLFGNPSSPTSYPVVYHSRSGNPVITWEKSLKRNIGFDSHFFNGILALNFDLFDERRTDLLTAHNSGFVHYGEVYPSGNYGEVYNKGYELELKYSQKFGEFRISFNAQVSHARNKIITKDEPLSTPENLKEAGKPVGQMFGYVTDGFYDTLEELNSGPTNLLTPVARVGDLKFVDINNDGVINENDRQPILSSTLPEYTYSFGPNLEWKGLSLNVMFQGTAKSVADYVQTFNWFEFMLGRWSPERYAAGEKITWPAVPYSYASQSINLKNDFIISDNSYLKLRNVELAWQLPDKYARRMKLGGVRLFLTGQNLYTWTKFKYYSDPEVVIGSAEYRKEYTYPSSRKFNIGVNIQF